MKTRITSGLTISVLIVLSLNCVVSRIARAGLRGACATVNITPPLGIKLVGSKGEPSDAIMDELYAKAMVLSDGPNTVAIISADYPAFATRVVEQVEGGTCLFTLTPAGNTVPVQRDVGPCERMGKALAGEALKRLQLTVTTGDVTLRACRKEISLPTKAAAPSQEGGDRKTADPVTTEIQVLRLGAITILGLPGEVLVEVGLEIERRASVENLCVVSLANDAIGYVCHRQAYEEGGYEPDSGTYLAPGAAEIMIERALALIREIVEPDHDGTEQPAMPGPRGEPDSQ